MEIRGFAGPLVDQRASLPPASPGHCDSEGDRNISWSPWSSPGSPDEQLWSHREYEQSLHCDLQEAERITYHIVL